MATITKIDLNPDMVSEVYGNLWYLVVLYSEGMDLRALESALTAICGHTPLAARSLAGMVHTDKSAVVAALSTEEEALVMQSAFTSRNIKTIVSQHA